MTGKSAAALLFSVYFLFSAVSPLTCVLQGKKAGRPGPASLACSRPEQNLRDFLLGLIGDRFSGQQRAAAKRDAAATIFIKKKRALPEDDQSRLGLPAPACTVSSVTLPLRDFPARFDASAPPADPHAGFLFPYAGHSPPPA